MRFLSSFSHGTKSVDADFPRMNTGVAVLVAQIPRHGPVDGLHVIEYK
jgi:hypothetical protein